MRSMLRYVLDRKSLASSLQRAGISVVIQILNASIGISIQSQRQYSSRIFDNGNSSKFRLILILRK